MALEPCLTQTALQVATNTTTTYERRYSLYSPELSLLAVTDASVVAAPPTAYEYIWFGSMPVAQVSLANAEIHYYFTDHLHTPVLQTDDSQRIVWQVEHEPYGEIHGVRRGEAKHQPLRFPGQEADGAGLVYNIFRWYRPWSGRYTSVRRQLELRGRDN